MSKVSYYTEDGFNNLKTELHKLKFHDRVKIAKAISDARDKGDLSENAEYDAAKEAQGILEMKIKDLEIALSSAAILSKDDIDISKVTILSKVELINRKLNKSFVYTIVAEKEANLVAGKISINSPIAKGIIGKKIGEIALVETPSGKIEYEIVNIGT